MGFAPTAIDLVEAILDTILRRYFQGLQDELNAEWLKKELEDQIPEVERRLTYERTRIAELQASGKAVYANVTVRMIYLTNPDTGNVIFWKAPIETIAVSTQEISHTKHVMQKSWVRYLLYEMQGRSEILLTNSYELPHLPDPALERGEIVEEEKITRHIANLDQRIKEIDKQANTNVITEDYSQELAQQRNELLRRRDILLRLLR